MGGHGDKQLDKEERNAMTDAVRFNEGCLFRGAKTMAEGAIAGSFLGAAMLSWYPDPYRYDMKNTRMPYALDVKYLVRGMRAPILWSGIVSGVYGLTECMVEQMRDPAKTSTWVNSSWAGAAAGLVMGSMTKRFDIMASTALGVGIIMGGVEFTGQGGNGQKAGRNMEGVQWWLPTTPESDSVKGLKEQYPEFKDL